jgi:alkylation response protein AidB-like acyl-CoA dehydrogenase
MNFSFSDDQVELRRAVHQALAGECSVTAVRDYYEATSEHRAALASARWKMLSDLGAPGLLVPESAGGLGLSDVDLVGVFEEAGWSALPEPLLETAGLAAPMLAALSPAPAATDALEALLSGTAPLAVGGIDVGLSGPSSPTTVSADGMLRTPRVVGAREADVFLLAARDPDSGWQLHAVRASACTVHATPTLDLARDLSTVHWPLSADTLLAYGVVGGGRG